MFWFFYTQISFLKSGLIGGFSIRFTDNSEVVYILLGLPVNAGHFPVKKVQIAPVLPDEFCSTA